MGVERKVDVSLDLRNMREVNRSNGGFRNVHYTKAEVLKGRRNNSRRK